MPSRSITRELPENYPDVIAKEYIAAIVEGWEQPAQQLFASVERMFSSRVRTLIKSHFDQHNAGALDSAVL